jgi:alpha-1,3/alpha-1,6-mannosyltransferase
MTRPLRIALLHPELGIGGAERLMVTAALALQARGHRVALFTARRDPAHCFEAARDGTLDVRVHGAGLPLQLMGRLRLPLAIARMLALGAAMRRDRDGFDVVLCDLAAHVIPLLRRAARLPIVFYCHFPDLLLTPPRYAWYRWYRAPLDRAEARGLDAADCVLVNSAFTARVYRQTFPQARQPPEVLHPGIDLGAFRSGAAPSRCDRIVAISRFAAGKNLLLAVDAYAELRARLSADRFAATRLVIAGDADPRLREPGDTIGALRERAGARGVAAQLELACSPSDAERRALLECARCVVYTPLREHFGYVPLEAMAAGRPVLAVNAGGPTETVVDGETGWLLPPTAGAFAAALHRAFDEPDLADRLGRGGRARAEREFSVAGFAARLEGICRRLRDDQRWRRGRNGN